MDCEKKRLRRGVWPVAGRLQHISHICQPWATSEEIAHMSERADLSGVHCANTVTCSVLYIWSHSEPAYWKLFITSDGGETDMSHVFSLMCCKQTSYFEIFWGLSQDLQELFCLYSVLSTECLTFILLPVFSSVSPSRSHSVFAYVCLRPPGAFRANTDQRFGPVPYPPPACADRPNANLLLISCRDEAIALFLRIACDDWSLISTRSISALQWSHLDKHQLWMFYLEGWDVRWWEDLARYFLVIKVNHQDFCLFCFKHWEPSLISACASILPNFLKVSTFSFSRVKVNLIAGLSWKFVKHT